jgi:ribose 5-phosphate isomerase A
MELAARLDVLGRHAAELVQPNSRVGLGSGSTAEAFVRALGGRVADGLRIETVATSNSTERLAHDYGIPLVPIESVSEIDLGIDGADEITPALDLTKGRGGALLFEKLVARACRRFVVIAADEKLVDKLGQRMPLPVEVVPFAWNHTAAHMEALGFKVTLRMRDAGQPSDPYVTDGGHYILDCATGAIDDPRDIGSRIKATPGVVDHGLFVGMTTGGLIVDGAGNVRVIEPITRQG